MPHPHPLRGIIPPLVTPLAARDQLDRQALARLVAHLAHGGVDGVFVLGTTGEGPSLSHRLRAQMVEAVCREALGRLPVLVAITDTCLTESLELAAHSAACGAAGLVLSSPYYFSLTQSELLRYVEGVASESPLPIYLYNIPALTRVVFSPETVRAAAQLPNVVGLKDSSGDMDYFRQAIDAVRGVEDFAVFMGPEELLAEGLRLGAAGGVPGGANLFPELYVRLHAEWRAGRHDQVERLHRLVMRISDRLYGIGTYGNTYLRGLKCALSLCGLCEDRLAPPYDSLNAEEHQAIRLALQDLNLLTREGEPKLQLAQACGGA